MGITVMGGRRPERHQRAKMVVVIDPSEGKSPMGKSIRNFAAVTRVGLDLAKKVFKVHAVDAKGEVVQHHSAIQCVSLKPGVKDFRREELVTEYVV